MSSRVLYTQVIRLPRVGGAAHEHATGSAEQSGSSDYGCRPTPHVFVNKCCQQQLVERDSRWQPKRRAESVIRTRGNEGVAFQPAMLLHRTSSICTAQLRPARTAAKGSVRGELRQNRQTCSKCSPPQRLQPPGEHTLSYARHITDNQLNAACLGGDEGLATLLSGEGQRPLAVMSPRRRVPAHRR